MAVGRSGIGANPLNFCDSVKDKTDPQEEEYLEVCMTGTHERTDQQHRQHRSAWVAPLREETTISRSPFFALHQQPRYCLLSGALLCSMYQVYISIAGDNSSPRRACCGETNKHSVVAERRNFVIKYALHVKGEKHYLPGGSARAHRQKSQTGRLQPLRGQTLSLEKKSIPPSSAPRETRSRRLPPPASSHPATGRSP